MSTAEPASEKRKSVDEMSREELIGMFQKVRSQTLQIASDKKLAVDMYETCAKEKEEIRLKALTIVQRCKELEDKLADYDSLNSRFKNQSLLIEEHTKYINHLEVELRKYTPDVPTHEFVVPTDLSSNHGSNFAYESKIRDLEASIEHVNAELAKYKVAMDKALPKLKELKLSLHNKTVDEARAVEENGQLKSRVWELEESLSMYESNGSILHERTALDMSTVSALATENNDTSLVSTTSSKSVSRKHRGNKRDNAPDAADIDEVEPSVELTELQNRIEELTLQNEKIREESRMKLTKAVERIKELKANEETKAQELFIANQSIGDLEKALHTLQQAQHEQVSHTMSELFEERATLQSQILELQEALANANSVANKEDAQNLEQVSKQLQQTQSQLESITAQCMELNTLASARAEELENVRSELQSQVQELTDANIQIKEASAVKITKAVEKIKAMTATIETQTQEIADMKMRTLELESQLATVQHGSEGQQSELTVLLENVRSEKDVLQSQLSSTQNDLATTQRDLETSISERDALKEQLAGTSEYLTKLMDENKGHILNDERVNYESGQLRLQVLDLSTQLESLREANQTALKQSADELLYLKSILDSKTAEADVSAQRVSELEAQLSIAQQGSEGQVVELNAMISQLQSERDSLQSKLSELDSTIAKYEKDYSDLRSELETQSAQHIVELSDVKSRSEELQASLIASEQSVHDLEGEVAELKTANETIRENSRAKMTKAVEKVKELNATMETKNQELTVMSQRVSELETQLSTAQQGSEGQNAELTSLISQLQKERLELQAQHSQELDSLKDTIVELTATNAALKEESQTKKQKAIQKIQELNAEISNKNQESLDLTERITSLETQLLTNQTESNSKVHDLEARLEEMGQDKTSMENEANATRTEIDQLSATHQELLISYGELQSQLGEKSALIESHQATISSLSTQLETLKEEDKVTTLNVIEKIEELNADLTAKDKEIAHAQQHVNELQMQLQAAQQGSEGQNAELSAMITQLQSERDTLQSDLAAKVDSLAEMTIALAASKNNCNVVHDQLNTLQSELDRVNKDLADAKASIAVVTTESDTKSLTLSDVERKLSETIASSEQYKATADAVKEKIKARLAAANENLKAVQVELDSSRKDFENCQQEIIELRLKCGEGEATRTQLSELLNAHELVLAEVANSQQRVIDLDTENGKFAEEISVLQGRAVESEQLLTTRILELTAEHEANVQALRDDFKAKEISSEEKVQQLTIELDTITTKLSDLESQLVLSCQRVSELESQLAAAQLGSEGQVVELNEMIFQLQNERDSLQSELQTSISEIEYKTSQISQLSADCVTLKNDLSAALAEIDVVRADRVMMVSQLEEQTAAHDTRIAQMKEKLVAAYNKIKELQTSRGSEMEAYESKQNDLASAIALQKEELGEKQAEIVELIASNAASKDECTVLTAKLNELSNDVQSKDVEISSLNSHLTELQAQLAAAQQGSEGQVAELNALISQLQGERDTLQSELTALQVVIEKHESENAGLRMSLQEHETQLSILRSSHESEVARFVDQNQELQAAFDEKSDSLLATQGVVSGLEADVAELKTANETIRENSRAKLTKAVEKVKELNATMETKNQELAVMSQRVSELESQLSAAQQGSEGQVVELNAMISQLQSERDSLKNDLSTALTVTDAIRAEIKELQTSRDTDKEAYESKQNDLASAIALQKEELGEKQAEIVELIASNAASKDECAVLTAKVDELSNDVQSKDVEINSLNSHLTELQAQLAAAQQGSEGQMTEMTAMISQLQGERDTLQSELTALQVVIEKHESENAGLRMSLQEHETQLSILRSSHESEVARFVAQNQELQAAFDEKSDSLLATQGVVSGLEADVAELKTANETIRENSRAKMTKAVEKVMELTATVETKNQELAVMSQRVSELESQLSAAQQGSEGQVVELNAMISQLQSERDSLKNDLSTALTETDAIRAEINELQTSRDTDKEAYESKQNDLASAIALQKEELGEKQAEIVELIASNAASKDECAVLTAKVNELSNDVQSKDVEINSLNSHLTELQAQLAAAQQGSEGQVAELNALISQLQGERNTLQSELTALQVVIEKHESENAGLRMSLQEQETQLSILRSSHESEVARVVTQNQELQAAFDEKSDSLLATQGVISGLEAEVAELKTANETIRENSRVKLTKAVEMVKELTATLETKNQELADMSQRVSELESQLSAAQQGSEGQVAELNAMISQLQSERDSLKNDLSTALTETDAIRAEINELQTSRDTDKEAYESKQNDLASAIALQKEELGEKQAEIVELIASNAASKDECAVLTAKLNELSNDVQSKDVEISSLNSHLTELQTQLAAAQQGSGGQTTETTTLISQLQGERDELQNELIQSRNLVNQMEIESTTIQQQLDQLTAEAESNVEQIASLESALQQQIQESEAATLHQKEQFKSKFTTVMEKLKEMRSELEVRNRDLNAANQRITELESQQLSNTPQTNEEKVTEHSVLFSQLQMEHSTLQDEMQKKDEQLEANVDEINRLESQLAVITAQCEMKSSEVLSLNTELDELKKSLQHAILESERCDKIIESLSDQVASTVTELSSASQKSIDLETRLEAAHQRLAHQGAELATALELVEKQEDGMEELLKEKTLKLQECEERLLAAKESQVLLNAQVLDANEEVDRKEIELTRINEEMSVLVTCNADLKVETERLTSLNSELQSQVNELTATISSQQEETRNRMSVAIEKYKELKTEHDLKVSELNTAILRITELEAVTADANKDNVASESSSEELVAFQREVVVLTSELQQSATECSQLRQTLATITTQCIELNTACESKTEQLEMLRCELEDAQSELQDAIASLQSTKDESKARSQKAIDKIKLLKSEKEDLTARLETAAQEIESRDTQLLSYSEHLNTLDLQIVSLNTTLSEKEKLLTQLEDALSEVKERESALRHHLGDRDRVPAHFEVLMRCSDGDRNWCLVSRAHSRHEEHKYGEDHQHDLSWHMESEVHAWIAAREHSRHDDNNGDGGGADSSFSIDLSSGDVEFPPVIQDELKEQYEREKNKLLSRLEELTTEKDNSQQAFDKYRERAKVSLMKTATELQAAELKVSAAQDQLKEEKLHAQQAETAKRQLEYTHQQALSRLQQAIKAEKDGIKALRDEITVIRADIATAEELEKQRLEIEARAVEESSVKISEDSGEWQAKVSLLAEQITELQSKEKSLTSEMRKKGDLARQIIIGKDEEIQLLKSKVKEAQKVSVLANDGMSCFQPQPVRGGVKGIAEAHFVAPLIDAHHQPQQSSSPTERSTVSPVITGETMSVNMVPRVVNSTKSVVQEQIMDREGHAKDNSEVKLAVIGAETQEILSAVEDHAMAAARALTSPHDMATFNQELYRKAVHREQELLEQIRHLKHEILRSKQSIMGTPRKAARPPSSPVNVPNHHDRVPLSSGVAPHSPSSTHSGMVTIFDTMEDGNNVDQEREDGEREQRLTYLKQAFLGFFKAKQSVEMQHLGRVICAILGLNEEEQFCVMEGILKLTPAVVATSTFESISGSLSSIFS